MAKVRIEYGPKQRTEVDNKWMLVMEGLGYEFIGSGYNFKTNKRDLSFSNEENI